MTDLPLESSSGVPFFDYVGVEKIRYLDGVGIAELSWRKSTANSSGRIHGGAVIATANAAMVKAVRTEAGGAPAALAQMSVNFLSSGRDKIVAHAHVDRAGKNLFFVSCKVTQFDSGNAVANVTAVFQIRVETVVR